MSAVEQLSTLLTEETPDTYADYLKSTIIKAVLDTNDEKLLSYIHTMLFAAVIAETPTKDC